MKKKFYTITTIMEVVLLLGAYIINYFTVKKLGMTRWVNHTCLAWEKAYPIFLIKMVTIALLVALTLLAYVLFKKYRKTLQKRVTVMTILMSILTFVAVGYILFGSFAARRAYYFICIMLVLTDLLQIVKTLVGIKVCKKENETSEAV